MTPPTPQYTAGAVDERTGEFEMSLAEARAILDGSAPPLVAEGSELESPTACGSCGTFVAHTGTHERFHLALIVLAAYVEAAFDKPTDDDQREADAVASGDAG